MKRFRLVALAVPVALGVFGLASRQTAVAATATSSFTVQATVVSSCTIASFGPSIGDSH